MVEISQGLIADLKDLKDRIDALLVKATEEAKSNNSAGEESDWLAKAQAELYGYASQE